MSMLDPLITPFLVIATAAYSALAVSVARMAPAGAPNVVSLFLLLIAGMLAGSAFSFSATDVHVYGVGRALSFISGGFSAVVFYTIYREYTVRAPNPLVVVSLCIVPAMTTVLVLTNALHNMIWIVNETPTGLSYSLATDHFWHNRVHAPFTYGLFAYSAVALIGRLPSIAPAHRKTIGLWLTCAAVPYTISVASAVLSIGSPHYPLTSLALALIWPCFAYVSVKQKVHEFSPLAYQTLFDHVRDPIFVVDKEQCIICANKAAQELLGDDENALLGRKLWEDFPAARAVLEQARELDLAQTLRMDANCVHEVSVGPLSGPRGQDLGMVVVCRDVTERRAVLSQLADSEHLVRTLIETSSNGILRFSRDGSDSDRTFRCVFANRAAESFTGEGFGTLVGMPLEKLSHLNSEKLLSHFGGSARTTSQVSFEVASESERDGSWLRVVGEPVGDDISVTLVDITQRKQDEEKMLADALRDPLTGVLNRRGFEKEGASAIRRSSQGAVLYLDLNQFKSINDRFGHQAGDALLRAFGHRLGFCLRPEDILGRLGGDEFSIVLPGVNIDDVRHIAIRLVQTAADAYIIQGQEITCTASVGIALMPKHGAELWHLLSVADQAMYAAKEISEEDAANDRAAYIDAAIAS